MGVTTMDDTLGWVFFDPQRGAEERPKLPLPIALWLFHRLYAICLLVALVTTVLQSERLLSMYGNEAKYGSVCSDIREIVTALPFGVCTVFAILHAPLRLALRWIDKDTVLLERKHRYEFGLRYAHIPVMSVEKWYCTIMSARFLCDLILPAGLVYAFRHAFVARDL